MFLLSLSLSSIEARMISFPETMRSVNSIIFLLILSVSVVHSQHGTIHFLDRAYRQKSSVRIF